MRICRFITGDDPRFGLVDGAGERIAEITGDPLYTRIELTGETFEVDQVRLLAPVIPRSKVVAIGRNYADHAKEVGGPKLTAPRIFLKPGSSVCGPGSLVRIPDSVTKPDWEVELAVVIGRTAWQVGEGTALDYVAGYTVLNDVSAREFQFDQPLPMTSFAKGLDGFCPLGPWLETDLDPQDFVDGRRVQTYLNGDVVQDGTTADMIFDVPALVAHVSSVMTLLPGDVILTGTPEGVGPMQVGDEVEISIAGIGALTNTVSQRS